MRKSEKTKASSRLPPTFPFTPVQADRDFVDALLTEAFKLGDGKKVLETGELPPGTELFDQVTLVEKGLELARMQVSRAIQALFSRNAGAPIGDIHAKKRFVTAIQAILVPMKLRIVCPKCNRLSNLRLGISLKYPEGVFECDHFIDKKRTTHRLGPELPALAVVSPDLAKFFPKEEP